MNWGWGGCTPAPSFMRCDMAYIQPNSIIEFFGDLSISPSYENSLYFENEAAKDSYFSGLTKLGTVSNCTYSRENRGFVRVELPMGRLIGATYMRFKNTSFENKWFYAFVKQVNWINNLTTEIQFNIDPLMTWMGTFTLNQCYIERQHTLNDGIGNNIAEEGLSIGEYVIEDKELITLGTSRIVMVYIENSADVADGKMIGGVYSPYKCAVFRPDQLSVINDLLETLVEKNLIQNVVSLYMCYSDITNSIVDSDGTGSEEVVIEKPYQSLNGYVPRNKKLFCYPYKFMEIDNREGDSHEYYYEYFNTLPDQTSSGNCNFYMYWVANAKCDVLIAPRNYKGNTQVGKNVLFNERIGMSHFPQCAFATDTYAAYLAQKNAYLMQEKTKANIKGAISGAVVAAGALSLGAVAAAPALAVAAPVAGLIAGPVAAGAGAAGAMGSLTTAAATIGTGAAVGGLVPMSKVIAENLIENKIRPTTPETASGDLTIDALFSASQKCFVAIKRCITKNYAMMLDSYFDMYGYAVKQRGIPNMNARPNWTFVKTIGCSVGGNLPADDAAAIETIFDNGIRFWKNHSNIGNYNLNNSPA